MKGKYVVISAPSAAGKSTLIKIVRETCKDCNFAFSISMTTRKPRQGEVDGQDYYFVTREQFLECIVNNELLEWEDVHGNLYGTPKAPVAKMANEGKNVIFDVDVTGGLNIRHNFEADALSIFIMPPSPEELRKRLVLRETETEEQIDRRMRRVEEELTYACEFDKVIINDDLMRAASEFETILRDYLGIHRT